MRQRFRRTFQLDRPPDPVYLGLGLHLALLLALAAASAACRSAAPGDVVPVDAAPVGAADVRQWVEQTVPAEPRLHKFKWLFQDERGSAGGRGSVRIAPPDSLRFDAAGLFDIQSSSAVVLGDKPLWVDPPDALDKLVPNYPLLWAMFGIARGPHGEAELRGLTDGQLTAWRYITGADTVDYRYTRDARGDATGLIAEVREGGQLVGRVETKLGPGGVPLKAKLVVPSVPAKLDLTFLSTTRTAFAPDTWQRRTR
jgi:hypothetical protein